MTPANAADLGFTVTVLPQETGSLRFTIQRDTTKAEWPARDARLEVRSGGKLAATCPLQERPAEGPKRVTYFFELSKEATAASTLIVSEVQTADGKPDGFKVVGGGNIYRFRLADFLRKAAAKSAP